MTHFLVVTTDAFGVLARVTSIVAASGINIEAATAYPISGSGFSVIHLRVQTDREQAERVRRKLARLLEVIEVRTDDEQSSLSIDLGMMLPFAAAGEHTARPA